MTNGVANILICNEVIFAVILFLVLLRCYLFYSLICNFISSFSSEMWLPSEKHFRKTLSWFLLAREDRSDILLKTSIYLVMRISSTIY